MTTASDPISVPAGGRRIRPFYWSLRRELWENRAIYLAPLAVAATVLAAFLFTSFHLPRAVLSAAGPGGARAAQHLNMPYAAVAGAMFVISFVVAMVKLILFQINPDLTPKLRDEYLKELDKLKKD